MSSDKSSKSLLIALGIPLYFLTVLVCLAAVFIQYRENRRFLSFTDTLFQNEISASTLNLHYTLASPDKAGITDYPITFGHHSLPDKTAWMASCENLSTILSCFRENLLTKDNRLILAILEKNCEAAASCPAASILAEPLSPSLGVQAQLPVLLAEYTFRTRQDIVDYLGLLKTLPDYFHEILAYEQYKSTAGLFMNDQAARGVVAQCRAFLQDSDDNYLKTMFADKLNNMQTLTAAERDNCLEIHNKLINSAVLPAYQNLIDGMTKLLGTGTISGGLANFPEGKSYYRYILKTQVGTDDSPEEIRTRLLAQLQSDAKEMKQLLADNPELPQVNTAVDVFLPLSEDSNTAPAFTSINSSEITLSQKMLTSLEAKIQQDFPPLDNTKYSIKYVHKALQEYSSPAFYLTPPVDTNSPNSIYINPAANMDNLSLYTTLAHEGFPGHLYQTIYFSRTSPQMIRHLYTPSGYVEGWATYVESYAYQYACKDPAVGRLQWLNRSMSLALYSLLDLGIHGEGWDVETASKLLSRFGVRDIHAVSDIYNYVVETPGNYLKYYYGYLNFLDLRDLAKRELGTHFDVKSFHQNVLELGPMPFSLLEDDLRSQATN